MKFFKYLSILLILILLSVSFLYLNNEYRWVKDLAYSSQSMSSSFSYSSSSSSSIDYKYKYYYNNKQDINLVMFNGDIDLVYNSKVANTFEDISKQNNFDLAINGGYFSDTRTYAGLLILNGVVKTKLSTSDSQLNAIVLLNRNSGEIKFFNVKDFNVSNYLSKSEYIIFQTGPIIIKNNLINNTDINNSVNGLGKYYRSVIGITKSGKKFIAISTDLYLLNDLAVQLLKMDPLKNESIDVINLDGGSSTAIYSFENRDFTFGSFKVLPIVLGIKSKS